MNDLENIPIALILNWASLICYPNVNSHMAFTIAFTVCRIGHTIAYTLKRQPSRGLFWFGGVISVMGFSITGLIGVLNIAKIK